MFNLEEKNKSFQKSISIAKSFKKIKYSINIFFIGVPTILISLFQFTTMILSINGIYSISLIDNIFFIFAILSLGLLISPTLGSLKLHKLYNRKNIKEINKIGLSTNFFTKYFFISNKKLKELIFEMKNINNDTINFFNENEEALFSYNLDNENDEQVLYDIFIHRFIFNEMTSFEKLTDFLPQVKQGKLLSKKDKELFIITQATLSYINISGITEFSLNQSSLIDFIDTNIIPFSENQTLDLIAKTLEDKQILVSNKDIDEENLLKLDLINRIKNINSSPKKPLLRVKSI